MMAALQGKTALVTGASLGIGRATASALAEAGAHVLAHYGRSVQDAESLVAEIQRGGPRAWIWRSWTSWMSKAFAFSMRVRRRASQCVLFALYPGVDVPGTGAAKSTAPIRRTKGQAPWENEKWEARIWQ